MAYDPKTDVYEHAAYRINMQIGSYGAKSYIAVVDVERKKQVAEDIPLHVKEPEKQAIVRRVIAKAERVYGINTWVKCSRTSVFCHVPDGHPKAKKQAPIDSLCAVMVNRGFHHDFCGRLIDGDDSMCKMHRNAENKREASHERWREESRQRREQQDRDQLRTEELKELWEMVCDHYDIEQRGQDPYVTGPTAKVDAELINRFLRMLVDR